MDKPFRKSGSAQAERHMDLQASQRYDSPRRAILSRTLPFALFMAFIAVDEGARLLAAYGGLKSNSTALYYLYPIKTGAVALLLYLFRRDYREFVFKDLTKFRITLAVSAAGLLVFVVWIWLDFVVAVVPSPGFDPMLLPEGVRVGMTLCRVVGAVLVVPLMEELFWRSFLLRYLINPDFESVPLGRFSWPSFLITVVLFGLEHHLLLAGMAAGAIYSLVLYKTRSLSQCVLAHAITNLALAIYVLLFGKWQFW